MARLRRDFLIHVRRTGKRSSISLAASTKEMLWVDQSYQRFYAYNHFGQHPEQLIAWFDKYMS
jgi:hypothetical protein